jgi:hypothetical protein
MKKFTEWLKIKEMCGTGAIYDPKAKGEFNWWGAPGSMGKTIKGNPIKRKKGK